MSLAALLNADFATPPFDHQFREFEEHCDAPARAKAWHMRTGKSKSCVDKAFHLFRAGVIDGVLIFAPNGVHANWVEREFPAHAWAGARWSGHIWRSVDSGSKGWKKLSKVQRAEWEAARTMWWEGLSLVKDNADLMVLAINTESMTRKDVRKAVARFMKHRKVYCIFDESDDWGTPGSKRTKMARSLGPKCAVREILSGTIATSSPLATFSQFELLKRGALGYTRAEDFNARYGVYEEAHGLGGRKYPKLTGFQNLDELRERMARFTSVVLRTDCHDMPDIVPRRREIAPTEEQLTVYRDLHASYLVDIAEERVSVGERAPRFAKLQQVFSGFVIDEAKKVRTIPGDNPRLDALAEEVFLAPGKVIVWCAFQEDMDRVAARLLVEGHESVGYHGRVSDKDKPISLATFRERRECKVLIAHPKSAGRGLDFSVASTIIWYSHTFSARFRAQAMERATKIGGKNISAIDFVAPGPDEHIVRTTDSRMDVADSLAGRGLKELLKGMDL